MKKSDKKAQQEISFGMIFSIFLIVVFLAFAFYAIKIFLGFQQRTTVNLFFKDLQDDVDRAWRSAESSEIKTYTLPTKITKVCFVDSTNNIVFQPSDAIQPSYGKINNLNISQTLKEIGGDGCIDATSGKVSFIITSGNPQAIITKNG